MGSLFSSDAWNNIGFTAAEVKNPKRDVALSMAFGTIIVIVLYCLANLAYLFALPLAQIQNAPDDRVATAALERHPRASRRRNHGRGDHHLDIRLQQRTDSCRISCGVRDGERRIVFRATGKLNAKGVPGTALVYQGVWITILMLLRTRHKPDGDVRQSLQRPAGLRRIRRVDFLRADDCRHFCVASKNGPKLIVHIRAFGYPVVPRSIWWRRRRSCLCSCCIRRRRLGRAS